MKTRIKITATILLIVLSGCSQEENNETQATIKTPLLSFSELNSLDKPFKHQQLLTPSFEIHETLGSGVAVIDIDNDGIYEVFFAQFEQNHTASVLYKRDGEKFKDITQESGLQNLTKLMGAAVADINNDGWDDLLLYGFKDIYLMINHKGLFKQQEVPQLPGDSFYTSASFFNANNDEYLDLWLSRYVDVSVSKTCKGSDGLRRYCAPSAYPFQADILLINNQGLSFSKAPKTLINIPASPSLGVVAADFNNDQLQDIFVANDGQNNFLFTQQSDGTFIENAEIKSLGSNLAGLKEASMGIAVGDYDNNGLIDLFLSHLEQETNTLYQNQGNWFIDVTNQTGLGAKSRKQTGFGTGFYDLNGDNWLDLFVINGRIQPKAYQERDNLTQQLSEKPLLFLSQDGQFKSEEIFENFKSVGRGLAFVDIDNDGDKDIISNNNNQIPSIFTNNLNPETWYGLKIRCHNRTDTNARITYSIQKPGKHQTFYKTIHTDGSYASASDPRVIIYLNKGDKLKTLETVFSSQTKKEISQQLIKNDYLTVDC